MCLDVTIGGDSTGPMPENVYLNGLKNCSLDHCNSVTLVCIESTCMYIIIVYGMIVLDV